MRALAKLQAFGFVERNEVKLTPDGILATKLNLSPLVRSMGLIWTTLILVGGQGYIDSNRVSCGGRYNCHGCHYGL